MCVCGGRWFAHLLPTISFFKHGSLEEEYSLHCKSTFWLEWLFFFAVMINWDGWCENKEILRSFVIVILPAKDWVLFYPFTLCFFYDRIQTSLMQTDISNGLEKAKEKKNIKTFYNVISNGRTCMGVLFRELNFYSWFGQNIVVRLTICFTFKPAGIIWVNNI